MLKIVHLALVTLSVSFFIVRATWAITGHSALNKPWVKVLPHSIDSLLLLSGLLLIVQTGFFPWQQPWLAAKLGALVAYIVLGSLAIKRGKTRCSKSLYGALALTAVGYMVSVALTKSALPPFFQ